MPLGGVESRNHGVVGALIRAWKTSHAPDYVGFVLLLLVYFSIHLMVDPFHQMFFVNDHRIMYPHAEVQRVNATFSLVYSLFTPLGLLIVYNIVRGSSLRKHEATYLAFAISVIMTSFITEVIKDSVGRPRPDLISRCKPQSGTPTDVPVTIDVCTETEHHLLHDGWRSFPSGHSSGAFSGLGFFSLFLAGQLHIFRQEGGGRDLVRALVCLAPLLGAALIAISRCEDYRHDVYDVCAGSLLGYGVAYWSYRRHWPRLTAQECDEPHPYPTLEGRPGWRPLRDEEEGSSSRHGAGIEMSRIDNGRR